MRRRIISGLLALVTLLLISSGCAARSDLNSLIAQKDKELASLQEKAAGLETQLKNLQDSQMATTNKVTLYFLQQTPTEFFLKPEVRQVKPEDNMPMVALRELIAGPKETGNKPLLPKDTKVLGLTIKNNVATVNFGEEITKLNVGSSVEALTVTSIVNTLTKFPEIERVKILVNGKAVESLAGHVDITGLLTRDDRKVRL